MTDTPPPAMPSEPAGWSAAAPAKAGPAAGLVYAGFGVRALAFIIDAIAISVLTAALAPFFGAGMMFDAATTQFEINYAYNGISTLLGLVYWVGFWAWRGQTVGMMPFNMRVVNAETGEKIDVVRGLLRYVGLIISFVVIFLGVIWVAFDARKQGWHDKIANTLVVRTG
ncbi:MAG: RDD family protein [bacterium]